MSQQGDSADKWAQVSGEDATVMRTDIGNTMCLYHHGQWDPVYMVGSILCTGQPYPVEGLETLVCAASYISREHEKACEAHDDGECLDEDCEQCSTIDALTTASTYLDNEVERLTDQHRFEVRRDGSTWDVTGPGAGAWAKFHQSAGGESWCVVDDAFAYVSAEHVSRAELLKEGYHVASNP